MAEKIVSPGVFTRENDLSFLEQGVAAIGSAFVGPFKEGPLAPTLVNTQAEFEAIYGNVDDTYYTPISVQNYLRENGYKDCFVIALKNNEKMDLMKARKETGQ